MPDKPLPPTPGNPTLPPPGKPLLKSFPTPNLQDRILQILVDSRKGAFTPPDKGSRYLGPNEEEFRDFKFSTCIPYPDSPVGWWLLFYLNERENQDAYNYSIEYPWVDKSYPRYTRTYVILREKLETPDPDETDPINPLLSLTRFNVTRADDPIIDSLFVAITKIFERVPAPTKFTLDRPESVLPFNMRVAVPATAVTEVQEEAAETPILDRNETDWTVDETTDSFNRRTVVRTKRVIPNGSITLNKGNELTREQQLASSEETWAEGDQTIVPRATIISSTIDDVGNNTTVKKEVTVDRVFPATEIKVEIPDIIPTPFRALVPTRTIGITSEGQVVEPVLQAGELERIHRAETDLIKREIVTGRDITQLPKTLTDFDIDGIPSHGSVFGGVYENARTLALGPQTVDEGFYVKQSSVQNLGNGLTLKETKQLSGVQGAHLLLTDGGTGFVCDPAVVFSSGTLGSDAAGTAVLSSVPGGGGTPTGEDIGGTFPLAFDSLGDANGIFYFLGARYNGGVWRNPSANGVVTLSAHTNSQITQAQLDLLVDRLPSFTHIEEFQGGSHYYQIDLGVGRTIKANLVTIRNASFSPAEIRHIRVQASNDTINWTTVANDIVMPNSINTWTATPITDTTRWRYFRIFRTDTNVTGATLSLGEIEFYGEAQIAPSAQLNYLFDGDNQGVFFYLGKRGNNGVWRNPAVNGDIVVSVDSPGTLTGDITGVVDRQPSNIYSDANPGRSFYFDLGTTRTLICNAVSFKQRTQFSSSNSSFNLQGSVDFSSWDDLVHVHNSQQADVWTTSPVASTTKYRYFRIISALPFFSVGEVELYGSLQLDVPGGTSGSTFSVTSVNMATGGHDYIDPPEVRFIGGGGTGASGTAVLTNHAVSDVNMTNPGIGYTGLPDVRFFVTGGGKDGAATANLVGDTVDNYTIDNPGVEYKEAPVIEIVGDGTGATAVATVNAAGQITAITPTAVGSGYTTASVLFVNVGGPTAAAVVGYGISSVTKTFAGSTGSYSSPPAVEVRGDGTGCQVRAVLGFPIANATVTAGGTGYTSTPTVQPSVVGQGGSLTSPVLTAVRGFSIATVNFTPNTTLFLTEPAVTVSGGGAFGQGAQFRAWIGRQVLALQLGTQGSNYSSDVAISLVDPGSTGTGATGAVVRSFAINSITGGTGGTGYTNATVTIDAPTGINGRTGLAHATIAAGMITAIVVDDPGFGYLVTPGVGITGDGTGATGWAATLETNGAIDSVSLGTGGTGYSEPPTVNITASSGTGAAITSVLDTSISNKLVKVTIVNPGSRYTIAPTLGISGEPNPTCTLSTSGQIVTVTGGGLNSAQGGSGYVQPAALIFSGGGGAGAAGTANLSQTGIVKFFVVDAPGEGFTTIPDVIVSSGNASGTAVLQSSGSVKSATLIDPGPNYSVAPLVSFFGCSGTGAAALYILASGYPILTDYITDPVEGIVVVVEKKIIEPDTIRPDGYVDIYALDKYRSIQITSRVDLTTLPDATTLSMTHIMNLPDTLVSIGSTYTRSISRAVGIDTAFGSTSVHSSVRGKIFAHVEHGYRGPVKATVYRKFMFGPPTAAQTPDPFIITPSSGTVYIISRGQKKTTSLGVRAGFGYIENTQDDDEDVDALDMSGLLTGGLISNQTSGSQSVDAIALASASLTRAQQAGFFFDGFRTNVAQNTVVGSADLIADIKPSCPAKILPGTTFLLSAVVEKWRFGIYVQTLTYVTVPCPGPSHLYLGQTVCDPCGGSITGPDTGT